ncbi:ABC-type multidrug transport system, ATPase and permease component [Paucilactobacillus hokkaidonensis JCM 18461]|uniref:ABC-type multidrug transport system, ATPase and permease component n=2 Tax=Paucilactobacillus hokkaidonensis TaxID=1193095 RepID=A0A0A1GVZ1_9LACO|nr:ABC transporter ATP-binding protein [Paucilactobacillus hokkaidonensis]KRO08960.1 ABC transporter [Paucilactobacillus hokkaidonensis]BAP86125.1 ABC-type multidrug transport system, ATPase and permease component [Paucilactobacillus hokkaidonensis JCM 18461]
MIKIARKNLNWWAATAALLFLLIQVSADLYLPTITSNLIDKGIAQNDQSYIWQQGINMLIVSFIGLLAAAGNVYFASTQSMKVGQKLRSQMFNKVVNFSSREFTDFGDSSLITRTTNDIVQIQNVMVTILRMMLQSPIMLIAAGVLAYNREPRLTTVFLVAIPILAVAVVAIMYFAVPLFKSIQKKTDRINLVFREGLTGVRVIRAFNQDKFEQDRFDVANHDYTKTATKAFVITSFMFPVMTLILSGSNIGIIFFGGHLIADMQMQVGNLVAFMTYATQILMSFMMLSMVFVFVPRASASAARINEVVERENSVADLPEDQIKQFDQTKPASLEFDDVEFKYRGAEQLALQGINFKARAGQTVAIIGGTGSGKSTLVNLIPRLFNFDDGNILVNDQPIEQVTQHALHEKISITQQKAVLFKGTIRTNLKYGNKDATDDQMWQALEIAQSKSFVTENGGLDAIVEQNGDNFSGGQRQRLAIARTIIKNASIYIFDDSFSALDFKTDAQLRMALHQDKQMSQAVMVIVAQRVSTVADADLILVMDDGKVVGQGTHQELKANNETYREIVDSQIRKGDAANA